MFDFNLSDIDLSDEMPIYEPAHEKKGNVKIQPENNNKMKNDKIYCNSQNHDADSSSEKLKPRIITNLISTSQFEPFTHFFIIFTKGQNLSRCSNRSLFLKIRVHPTIPIIETPSVWCSDRDAIFNVAYSLDFTTIPSFNISDFTPVVELYRRYSNNNELIAVSLLPIKVKEIVKCNSKTLTYLYRETPIILRDKSNGNNAGSLITTAAFGFIDHAPYLDPNFRSMKTENVIADVTPIIDSQKNSQNNKTTPKKTIELSHDNISRDNENISNSLSFNYNYLDYKRVHKNSKSNSRSKRHRHHDHRSRHKTTDYNWVDEAIQLGWKPPGSVDTEWEKKARAKGWKPPHEFKTSDFGVTCDLNDNSLQNYRKSASIQTENINVQIQPEVNPIMNNNSNIKLNKTKLDVSNDSDDFELFKLLNPQLKKNKSKIKKNQYKNPNELLISEPQSYSEIYNSPKKPTIKKELHFVKSITLFQNEPLKYIDDSNDNSIHIDKIHDIITCPSHQKNSLKSYKQLSLSDDNSKNSSEIDFSYETSLKNAINNIKSSMSPKQTSFNDKLYKPPSFYLDMHKSLNSVLTDIDTDSSCDSDDGCNNNSLDSSTDIDPIAILNKIKQGQFFS